MVALSSSNPAVVNVPATVTIPQWATSVSYTVITSPVAQLDASTISASSGNAMQTSTLTVAPPTPIALILDQSSIEGESSCSGTVELSGPAPRDGVLITLSSSNTMVASVPDTVTIPAGATTATFIVNTISVPESTSVTFSASYQGMTRMVNLTVSP